MDPFEGLEHCAYEMWGSWCPWEWHHGFSGWGLFVFAVYIIVLVGLVVAAILFVKWVFEQIKPRTKSALDILNEKYARGEISE